MADPVGSYLAGESMVVWFHEGLAGGFTFKRLAHGDHGLLVTLLGAHVLQPPYDMIVDVSTVDVFDTKSFALLATFLDSDLGKHALYSLGQLALVKPAGLAGASVAGLFYEKIRKHADAELFDNRATAFDWLGYDSDAPERDQAEHVLETVFGVSPSVRALRDWLERDLVDATLARAAQALAMSERTLQRELSRAKTSFRAELSRVRVRVAETLLTSTDDKVETIARQLGYASVPAFTTSFSKLYGETPIELRRRRARS